MSILRLKKKKVLVKVDILTLWRGYNINFPVLKKLTAIFQKIFSINLLKEFVYWQNPKTFHIKKAVTWRADTNIKALEGMLVALYEYK